MQGAELAELRAALQAAGLRLHSMDLGPHQPPWGVFNISALAPCVDYLLPMAYCSPASNTVAGPTLPLAKLAFVAIVAVQFQCTPSSPSSTIQ